MFRFYIEEIETLKVGIFYFILISNERRKKKGKKDGKDKRSEKPVSL